MDKCGIYIYTMEYSAKKENLTYFNNKDGPWGYYAKSNKPEREKQILYDMLICLKKKSKAETLIVGKWSPGDAGGGNREKLVKDTNFQPKGEYYGAKTFLSETG